MSDIKNHKRLYLKINLFTNVFLKRSVFDEYATGHVFKVLCPLQNHIRRPNLD